MLEPKKIMIGEREFQLLPLPVMKAIKLDKRVAALAAPVIAPLLDKGSEEVVDLGALGNAVAAALQSLPDSSFEELLRELVRTATYLPFGGAPVALIDDKSLDEAFSGDLVGLYRLAVEVMKFNKFSFFAGAGGFGRAVVDSSDKASGN